MGLWFYAEMGRAMKTTVEVSDDLYRRAKAEAAGVLERVQAVGEGRKRCRESRPARQRGSAALTYPTSGLIHSGDSQIARSSSSSRHESMAPRRCSPPSTSRLVAETNADPKPFVWTADPRRVLAAVKRGKQALGSIH